MKQNLLIVEENIQYVRVQNEIQGNLTSVYDFAKHCRSLGCRTVPTAVAELPLALLDGCLKPGGDGMEDARVLTYQPPLPTA